MQPMIAHSHSTYPKGKEVFVFQRQFVVNQTLVFQIKFCGKVALQVAARRWHTLKNNKWTYSKSLVE